MKLSSKNSIAVDGALIETLDGSLDWGDQVETWSLVIYFMLFFIVSISILSFFLYFHMLYINII